MNSNNLTISIPTPKCKNNCPYCVTKMTGRVSECNIAFKANLKKAKTLAKMSGVTSILVTGKGEPLDNLKDLQGVYSTFSEFPVEVQVNGERYMNMKMTSEEKAALNDFDIIALSFDRIPQNLVRKTLGLHRVTFIIHDSFKGCKFKDLLRFCKTHNIDQLSLRRPTIPANALSSAESQSAKLWITQHTKEKVYEELIEEFNVEYKNTGIAVPVRSTNFGATIYDVEGISFTHFDYCVQDTNTDNNIRSLIYMEDGHLYTSWSFQSSKIF